MKKKYVYNNINPLFFLFTCVKEGRPYIEKLFNSLLSQTKVNFIHYIYEDGSSDPIEDLVEEYKKKTAKLNQPYQIIYEKNPTNIGLNMATKHCIDICFLKYFIWIDCDNWVNDIFFEELEKTVFKNRKYCIIRTNRIDIDMSNNSSLIFDSIKNKKNLLKKNQTIPFFLNDYFYSFFAVNKEMLLRGKKQILMFDTKYPLNDDQVISTAVFTKNKFCFSKRSISYFLVRADSVSALAKKENAFKYEREKYIEIAKFYSYKYADKLSFIFNTLDLFNRFINEFHSKNYKYAYEIFKKKINYSIKNKVPFKFRCRYRNDFVWFFILVLKIVFR